MRWGAVAAGLAFALARAPAADACSPPFPTTTALPRTGATGVSTATSVIVLLRDQPSQLAMTANGEDVPIDGAELIAYGNDGTTGQTGGFWRVRGPQFLQPQTEYVVTSSVRGVPQTLTRFTTGAGYDKDPGTPAAIRTLRLWRVRYPLSEIASGNCVFAEYHGFIRLDYAPAVVPGTPDDSVVHLIYLAPRTGGAKSVFATTGGQYMFLGSVAEGLHPTPDMLWGPDLDATREYCVSIQAFGQGDQARGWSLGNEVCATVTEIDARGGTIGEDGGTGAGAGGGGCAVAGARDPAGRALLALLALLGLGRALTRRSGIRSMR